MVAASSHNDNDCECITARDTFSDESIVRSSGTLQQNKVTGHIMTSSSLPV